MTFLISLVINQVAFSQEEKIYYDAEWKVCKESKAKYYRLLVFDDNRKPKGKIKDFYISGELQCESESAKFIHKYDDSRSIFIGKSTGYFKSGVKQFETLHDNKGSILNHKIYYENGNKSYEVVYKNGGHDWYVKEYYETGVLEKEYSYKNHELDGKYTIYHQNGFINFQDELKEGVSILKFILRCDEFGKCKKVFLEDFSFGNKNKWKIINDNIYKSYVTDNSGLYIETKSDKRFSNTINIPLNNINDFAIDVSLDYDYETYKYQKGDWGIIWGGLDLDNFNFFLTDSKGAFAIFSKKEGIKLTLKNWTKTNLLKQKNKLKILRISDKLFFSINGHIVHSDNFYPSKGNSIGILVGGNSKVFFKELKVTQDIDDQIETSIDSNENEWKGNGTGFFIDKSGYIATNYHVVEDATEIEIEFVRNGTKQKFPAKVVQSDKQNDISIIKITSPDFDSFAKLPFNFKTNISDVGSNVFALGYPLLSLMGDEIKFTDGKISSKTGIQGDITTYQISVPIQPRNSGGPLFDFNGNLIGITSSGINRKLDITENVNYAIKSSYLKNLIDVLDYRLELPYDSSISNLTLTEKIKKLSDYVVLIKIK